MASVSVKFTRTQTILGTALLLILGAMACPYTSRERSDPTRELERMHAPVAVTRASLALEARLPASEPHRPKSEQDSDEATVGTQPRR